MQTNWFKTSAVWEMMPNEHQQDLRDKEGGEQVAIAPYGWRQERGRWGMTAPGLTIQEK